MELTAAQARERSQRAKTAFELLKHKLDNLIAKEAELGMHSSRLDWTYPMSSDDRLRLLTEYRDRGFEISVNDRLGGFTVTVSW